LVAFTANAGGLPSQLGPCGYRSLIPTSGGERALVICAKTTMPFDHTPRLLPQNVIANRV